MSAPVALTDHGGAQPFIVSEPRCKICQSPHRAEIDAMLRRGDSQASVRRHWNDVLGQDNLTANNLSGHARNHLYATNPTEWIRKTLRKQRLIGNPEGIAPELRPEDALLTVIKDGLAQLDAGTTVTKPGDIVGAARELNRIRDQSAKATEHEVLREMKLYTEAVRENVDQATMERIYERFIELADAAQAP